MSAERLRPHYAVTEALRTGRPFFDRPASRSDAVDSLREEVVATADEIAAVAARVLDGRRGDDAADAIAPAVRSLRAAAAETADASQAAGPLDRLGRSGS
jgi:hypothetical protein